MIKYYYCPILGLRYMDIEKPKLKKKSKYIRNNSSKYSHKRAKYYSK